MGMTGTCSGSWGFQRARPGTDPCNVRQLRTSLRATATLSRGEPITVAQLGLDDEGAAAPAVAVPRTAPSGGSRRAPSAEDLAAVLREANGNVVHAAQRLGTHPRKLYRWIEKHGLAIESFRKESLRQVVLGISRCDGRGRTTTTGRGRNTTICADMPS